MIGTQYSGYTLNNTQCKKPNQKKIKTAVNFVKLNRKLQFLPRDANAERSYEIACCPSIRLSVCL